MPVFEWTIVIFFCPINIDTGSEEHELIAFSRDISPAGIGFFHNVPLDTGLVNFSLPTLAGRTIQVQAETLWCEPCGGGWHLSGGQFLDINSRK